MSAARAIVSGVTSALARYDSDHLSSLSSDRRRASLRVLCELEAMLGDDASQVDSHSVERLLAARAAGDRSAATVRRERAIIVAFCDWAHRERLINAETLLAVRGVRVSGAAARRVQPQPYSRRELLALRSTLDSRWPLLSPEDAERWLGRFRDGRSPYSRVRAHVIRCQLDAIISLALYVGLRRHEIYALDVVTAHSDNDQIVVWRSGMERADGREPLLERVDRGVPYTALPRAAMARWEGCLHAIGVDHTGIWLNAHAGPTVREPLKRDRFHKLLATYVGPGWSLKRLRDTCAVTWLRAGLSPERLRELLGLARIEDVLPYAQLTRGTLDDEMGRVEG